VSFAFLVTAVLAVQSPATTGDSSAYLDAAARRLVAAARTRRETIDRSITAYRTRMRERIGVGVRALRRDRMLYRREIALQIDWRRDSVTRIEGEPFAVSIGGVEKRVAPESPRHSALYEIDGPHVLVSPEWAKAVEEGRWPGEVRHRLLADPVLAASAARLGATPVQIALAWLLDLAPNILLIPGTRTRVHLDE